MIMKINSKTTIFPLFVVILFSCKKEANNSYEVYENVDSFTASFTVAPVQGSSTKFVVTNTTKGNYVGTYWDLDQGGGFAGGKAVDTIFYPLAGTYNIRMRALDKRGGLYTTNPITVTTTVNDPRYLIKGGMMKPGDNQYWTKLDIVNGFGMSWTFANGTYTATTPVYPPTAKYAGAIYQAVQVQANKTYHFSMNVSYGTSSNSWVQIYFGTTVPANGSDYTDNQKINCYTYAASEAAFSGTKTVDVSFATAGTIYVVLKVGCNAGGHISSQGTAFSNVSLYSDY
jgi:hypothetical protein